jgi:hypothetical protein
MSCPVRFQPSCPYPNAQSRTPPELTCTQFRLRTINAITCRQPGWEGVLGGGSTDFGKVDLGLAAQTVITLSNVGNCDLHVCRGSRSDRSGRAGVSRAAQAAAAASTIRGTTVSTIITTTASITTRTTRTSPASRTAPRAQSGTDATSATTMTTDAVPASAARSSGSSETRSRRRCAPARRCLSPSGSPRRVSSTPAVNW